MNAPALMSAAQLDDYAGFLLRLAGKRRGSLADFLREAAARLRAQWGGL